jgi:SagB-type dehydrogenase family enzyme
MTDSIEQLCLNPFLVSRRRPAQDGFTCENPFLNTDFVLEGGSFAQLVAALRGAVGRAEIQAILCERFELDGDAAAALTQEMIDAGVLMDRGAPRAKTSLASRQLFDRYGWSSAFYFHNAVRDYPFLDYAMPEGRAPDYELMRAYLAEHGLPDKYKTYDCVPLLLEKCEEQFRFRAEIAGLLAYAESSAHRPLGRDSFSRLMYLTMGQIGKKPWPDQGYLVRRTSPSGGARHPTEAYVVVFDIEGIPPGVYHYNTRDHGLNPLRTADPAALRAEADRAAPDLRSRVAFEPRALVFFTTIPERSMWRYRDSRSYRVLFIDLGHLLATFRMLCCGLQIKHFVGQGIRENEVERLVGIDGIDESALYFGAIE